VPGRDALILLAPSISQAEVQDAAPSTSLSASAIADRFRPFIAVFAHLRQKR